MKTFETWPINYSNRLFHTPEAYDMAYLDTVVNLSWQNPKADSDLTTVFRDVGGEFYFLEDGVVGLGEYFFFRRGVNCRGYLFGVNYSVPPYYPPAHVKTPPTPEGLPGIHVWLTSVSSISFDPELIRPGGSVVILGQAPEEPDWSELAELVSWFSTVHFVRPHTALDRQTYYLVLGGRGEPKPPFSEFRLKNWFTGEVAKPVDGSKYSLKSVQAKLYQSMGLKLVN